MDNNLAYQWFDRDTIDKINPDVLISAIKTYQDAFAREPWNEYFPEAEVRESFLHLMTNGDLVLMILDNTVVGFAGGYKYQDESTYYIDELAISPHHQGKGYGSLLLQTLLTRICPTVNRITLRTSSKNAAAMALYTKFGFVPTGKSEITYQMRQDGRIQADERIYLCNDFRLNRVVIVELDGKLIALIFDNCDGYNRKLLRNNLHSTWKSMHPDYNSLDESCLVKMPIDSQSIVRFESLKYDYDTTAIQAGLAFLIGNQEYKAKYELSGMDSCFQFEFSDGMLCLETPLSHVTAPAPSINVIYDGRLRLYL